MFGVLSMRNVPHILEKIFFSLDHKSFKTCMGVNKPWRALLSTARYRKRLVELLIEKEENEEKLLDASEDGDIEEVKRLISNCMVDVNTHGKYHCTFSTPLIEAVRKGHKEVVNILLDAGALVDKSSRDRTTPLHVASNYHVPIDIVKLLIDNGAQLDIRNGMGQTPLILATGHAYEGTCNAKVKLLLDAGALVNKADEDGYTPLMWTAIRGFPDITLTLINGGADIDKANNKGWTPLRLAEIYGHEEVAKLLLERGADPQYKTLVYNS